MPDSDTLTIRGTEIEATHIDALANGGARFDFETARDRYRVDVSRSGETELVTTWRDGQLADLDEPEWLDDVVARLALV